MKKLEEVSLKIYAVVEITYSHFEMWLNPKIEWFFKNGNK